MTEDKWVLLVVAALVLTCLGLLVTLTAARRAWRRELAGVHADLAHLQLRLDEAERAGLTSSARGTESVEFLITDLGREPTPEPVRLDGSAFADIVLKETVVKAAALARGLRRALAPQTRSRIRFEMKQEVRRARKQRRADARTAQREWRARQRTALARESRQAS